MRRLSIAVMLAVLLALTGCQAFSERRLLRATRELADDVALGVPSQSRLVVAHAQVRMNGAQHSCPVLSSMVVGVLANRGLQVRAVDLDALLQLVGQEMSANFAEDIDRPRFMNGRIAVLLDVTAGHSIIVLTAHAVRLSTAEEIVFVRKTTSRSRRTDILLLNGVGR